jgi:hypothetical protein
MEGMTEGRGKIWPIEAGGSEISTEPGGGGTGATATVRIDSCRTQGSDAVTDLLRRSAADGNLGMFGRRRKFLCVAPGHTLQPAKNG